MLEFSQQVAATPSRMLMQWGADLSHFPSAVIVRRTIAKIHRNTVKYEVLRPSGHPKNTPGARFVCSVSRAWRVNRQNSQHFVAKSLRSSLSRSFGILKRPSSRIGFWGSNSHATFVFKFARLASKTKQPALCWEIPRSIIPL